MLLNGASGSWLYYNRVAKAMEKLKTSSMTPKLRKAHEDIYIRHAEVQTSSTSRTLMVVGTGDSMLSTVWDLSLYSKQVHMQGPS